MLSQGLLGNQALRDELANFIIYSANVQADNRAMFAATTQRLEAWSRAAAVLAAVDLLAQGVDVGAVLKDLGSAHAAETWTATVAEAVVTLTPTTAFLTPNAAPAGFVASLRDNPNPPPGSLVYRWTAGPRGLVGDYRQQAAPSLVTTSNAAYYLAQDPLHIDTTFHDTVTVEVFPDDGSHQLPADGGTVGSRTATLTGKLQVVAETTARAAILTATMAADSRFDQVACYHIYFDRVDDPRAIYTLHGVHTAAPDDGQPVDFTITEADLRTGNYFADDGQCGYSYTSVGGQTFFTAGSGSGVFKWGGLATWRTVQGPPTPEDQAAFAANLRDLNALAARAQWTVLTVLAATQ